METPLTVPNIARTPRIPVVLPWPSGDPGQIVGSVEPLYGGGPVHRCVPCGNRKVYFPRDVPLRATLVCPICKKGWFSP
jgi:hypothetical protein